MYIFLIGNIRSSLIYLCGFQLLVLLPELIVIFSFVCTNSKSSSKVKFRPASNHCKRVLETPNLIMLIKQESIIS